MKEVLSGDVCASWIGIFTQEDRTRKKSEYLPKKIVREN